MKTGQSEGLTRKPQEEGYNNTSLLTYVFVFTTETLHETNCPIKRVILTF